MLALSLLAEQPPLLALRLWREQFADYSQKKHGTEDVVKAAMSERDLAETYGPMVDAVRLMEACTDKSEIPDPMNPEDFLQLPALLMQLPPREEGNARSVRLLTFVGRMLILQRRSEDNGRSSVDGKCA